MVTMILLIHLYQCEREAVHLDHPIHQDGELVYVGHHNNHVLLNEVGLLVALVAVQSHVNEIVQRVAVRVQITRNVKKLVVNIKKKKTLENPRNLKSQRRKRKIQVIVGVVIVIVIVIVKTKLNVINQRTEIKVMRIDQLEVVKEVLKEVAVDKVKPMDLAQHKQRVERMPFVVLSSLLQGGVRTVPIVSTVMWNNRQLKCCTFPIGIFINVFE